MSTRHAGMRAAARPRARRDQKMGLDERVENENCCCARWETMPIKMANTKIRWEPCVFEAARHRMMKNRPSAIRKGVSAARPPS